MGIMYVYFAPMRCPDAAQESGAAGSRQGYRAIIDVRATYRRMQPDHSAAARAAMTLAEARLAFDTIR